MLTNAHGNDSLFHDYILDICFLFFWCWIYLYFRRVWMELTRIRIRPLRRRKKRVRLRVQIRSASKPRIRIQNKLCVYLITWMLAAVPPWWVPSNRADCAILWTESKFRIRDSEYVHILVVSGFKLILLQLYQLNFFSMSIEQNI